MEKLYIIFIIGLVFLSAFLSGCAQTSNNQNNETDGKTSNNQNDGKGENLTNNDKGKDVNQYQWSKMETGPYHDKISYATSTNLFDWTDSRIILAEHASVPDAVYKDGVIYVYFVDVSEDGKPEQIGLIHSEDNGQTWSSKEYVSFEGIGDKVPVDPAPFLLDDGRIRLYYFDINEARTSNDPERLNKIYSAVSTDGLHFIQEDGVRFEHTNIFDPDVVCVEGVWRLYIGYPPMNQVLSAVSSDGLVFTKEGVAYTGGTVPDVFYKEGTYYLYTTGIDISTSQTGASFTKTPSTFRSQLGRVTADASVIQLNNGMYMMLYKTM